VVVCSLAAKRHKTKITVAYQSSDYCTGTVAAVGMFCCRNGDSRDMSGCNRPSCRGLRKCIHCYRHS